MTVREIDDCLFVRKHPAPEGVLRLIDAQAEEEGLVGQKAPSTRRCIKTVMMIPFGSAEAKSESTSHQKVH